MFGWDQPASVLPTERSGEHTSYHLRNVVGNLWNNYLAGLANPTYYLDAMKVQLGTTKELQVGGRTLDLNTITHMLEDFGVTQGTFVAGEVMSKGLPGLRRVQFTAEDIPALGKVVTFGLKTGRELENNARIAHFLFQLDQGKSAMDAALSVKKYLFDYTTGLTGFEQAVMRRIFPFYAWTRFNVPRRCA